jgi:hypothetical protein
MVTKHEAFPSKYLKAADLEGPTTAIVKVASFETLKGFDGKEQQKVVLYFAHGLKPMPLNLTNYDSVADALGTDETDEWPGGKIELFPSTMGGKTLDCIRIRKPNVDKPKKVTKLLPKAPKPTLAADLDDEIPFS